jgi:hypothetical protein
MTKNDAYKNDEYRANAAECERMARFTRNESEKRTWLDMAEAWLRMIKPAAQSAAADHFDKTGPQGPHPLPSRAEH